MRHRSSNLIPGIDHTPFVNVMVVLSAIAVLVAMIVPNPHHHSSVDLPRVRLATPMSHALSEDALIVAVMRDSTIFFGTQHMPIDNLPDYIRDGVKHGAENRVYIKADARAKCGAVKEVIDDVHSSGVEMIGFLADERKAPPLD